MKSLVFTTHIWKSFSFYHTRLSQPWFFIGRVLKKEKRALIFARLRCCSGIWQPFYTILVSSYFALFNQYKKYGKILTLKNCGVWRWPPPLFQYLLQDFSFVAKFSDAKKGMWYKNSTWTLILRKSSFYQVLLSFKEERRNHKDNKKSKEKDKDVKKRHQMVFECCWISMKKRGNWYRARRTFLTKQHNSDRLWLFSTIISVVSFSFCFGLEPNFSTHQSLFE